MVFGVFRPGSAPVTIRLLGKPDAGVSQFTFILTNRTQEDLKWLSIIEVGGPDRWVPAATQPKRSGPTGSPYRPLPAQTGYWLTVSVPEERGTWRVRCIMMRKQTPMEKRFAAILNRLRLARWHWTVISPSITADAVADQ